MKITCFLLLVALLPANRLFAQGHPIGQFDNHEDVGNPAIGGSAVYNPDDQTYLLSGAGKNIWTNADQFQYVWKKIKGDFIVETTVRFIGEGVAGHRKIGIMARDRLTTNSRYADCSVHGGLPLLTALQYRAADDDTTAQVILSSYHPTQIRFERSGDLFTFSAAVYGENYKTVSKEIALDDEVYVGLYICSHVETVVEKAVFSNVRIIIPAAKDFRPYRDYIGSHVETMDVATGIRKILYSDPGSLQAPVWTRDDRALIYIANGRLARLDLASGRVSVIPSGSIDDLNNDHVLSFDGKMLGISNHLGDRSVIYILPVTGSDRPVQITADSLAPSYLHGWSPDDRRLVFTGRRKGSFNIISIDIATRKETPLTNTTTLNDGPEYTPDGSYIYFNSVRTGTMKIWRMKPDGSGQEQVTFDEYNDWFPHISPDGKWILYESFPKEIDPASHPFYKPIYLRLMPAAGGVPRTIAYLYGGQGTINVPSWSPDSKRIAFISNSVIAPQ
jgi:hypothetical protein